MTTRQTSSEQTTEAAGPGELRAPVGPENQPLATVQWVERGELSSNNWNPNRQAPPEHRLLKTSILENGWTQPIVVRSEEDRLEIVDGYHRWLISEDEEVTALTGGLVPIVTLPPTDPMTARMATIRHNRARGTHHVLGMAAIVHDLLAEGLTPEEISVRLEMDPEEISRLAQRGGMIRHAQDGFGKGWVPSEAARDR